jgi:hypothetical protein
MAELRLSNVRYNTGVMRGYQLFTVVASKDTLYLLRGSLDADDQIMINPIQEGAPLVAYPILILMALMAALLTTIVRAVRIKRHTRELAQTSYAQLAKKTGNIAIPRSEVIEVSGPSNTQWRNQDALALDIKTAQGQYNLLCVIATDETVFTFGNTISPKARRNELQQLKAWLQSKEQQVEQSSPRNIENTPSSVRSDPTGDASAEKLDAEAFQRDFQEHYRTHYGVRGREYQAYLPAYQYGFSLAHDGRYTHLDWSQVEPRARLYWEVHSEAAWEDVKDAVAYAWKRAKATT